MEKLYIEHEGTHYYWSAYSDFYPQYWETSLNGDGIYSVNFKSNSRRCVVGECDWRICNTNKSTRAKIRKWMSED